MGTHASIGQPMDGPSTPQLASRIQIGKEGGRECGEAGLGFGQATAKVAKPVARANCVLSSSEPPIPWLAQMNRERQGEIDKVGH